MRYSSRLDRLLAALQRGMLHGYRVGRVAGVEVHVHLLLLLLVGLTLAGDLVALLRGSISLLELLLGGVAFWVILAGSVLWHELGHCHGSRIVGGRPHLVVLGPLGGLAVTEGAERSPAADLLVTLLGPAANLVVAVPLHAALWLGGDALLAAGRAGAIVALLAGWIVAVNYMLAVFNLAVPMLPMDAGRIVRAAMAMRVDSSRANYQAATLGLYVGGAGLAASLFFPQASVGPIVAGPWFGMICILGLFTCWQERLRARHERLYEGEVATGGRPRYLHTTAEWRSPAWLRGLMRLGARIGAARPGARRGGPAAEGGRGPARVITLTPAVTRAQRLRRAEAELREAIRAEDFARAQELKRRIEELRRSDDREG